MGTLSMKSMTMKGVLRGLLQLESWKCTFGTGMFSDVLHCGDRTLDHP